MMLQVALSSFFLGSSIGIEELNHSIAKVFDQIYLVIVPVAYF